MSYYDARYDVWASRQTGPLEAGTWHAVHLARLTGTEIILPLAFLDCASLGPYLLSGYKREDGTRIHLSDKDLVRAFTFAQDLRRRDLNIAQDLGPYFAKCGAVEGCADPFNCRRTASVGWSMNVSRRQL